MKQKTVAWLLGSSLLWGLCSVEASQSLSFAEDYTLEQISETWEGTVVTEGDFSVMEGVLVEYTGSDPHLTLPSTIAGQELHSIGKGAFAQNQNLQSVTLPEGLSHIQAGAFSVCTQLQEVHFPSTLEHIDEYAFSECVALESLTLPTSLTTISAGAFAACKGLTEVSLPNSVTALGDAVFANCDNLQTVTLPTGITEIPASFFAECINLTEIHLPHGVEALRAMAFYRCTSLKSIKLPDTVTLLDEGVFTDCIALKEVDFSQNLEQIGRGAFQNCEKLAKVHLPNSLHTMEAMAFSGCRSLSHLTLSNQLKVISDMAFYQCANLATVNIPSSVQRIEHSAFYFCGNLSQVSLPLSLFSIADDAFYHTAPTVSVAYSGNEDQWKNVSVGERNQMVSTWEMSYLTGFFPVESEESMDFPLWAEPYLDYVLSQGIMPDVTPENCTEASSRWLIAQCLYNMKSGGLVVEPTHSFSDVAGFEYAVAWVHHLGIMGGYSETEFGGAGELTRQQFALILWQFAKHLDLDTSYDLETLSRFPDQGDIFDWAEAGVAWAVSQGLMNGTEGYLNPQGMVTCTEVAVMLFQLEKL